jgi:glyoxylase-like metal-dependent hydrolase (beta-lactamase superfamily II)
MGIPNYEIFAIRYATVDRRSRDNFISTDLPDAPMPMDYFVWAIRGPDQDVVVDTGFTEATARARNRRYLHSPIDALRHLGFDPEKVKHVVITHLHYDHAGNLARFPAAKFHVQEAEVGYATGKFMLHRPLRHAYDVEDVVWMVRSIYAGRVLFHGDSGEVLPGITLHHVGGHTAGLQVVRVHTARGWVVLASDATHFYENLRGRSPFPIVHDVGAMLEGYRLLEDLADGPDHIVPGHDPAVVRLFPRVPGLGFDAVRLDLPPIPSAIGKVEPGRDS